MKRTEFLHNFSKRLNAQMQKAGYSSNRSIAGVEINKLAKIAGVSYQMARKYSLGMALPEFNIIPKIASWLNVSSSWLLFGEIDSNKSSSKSSTLIEIESEILKYILQKCIVFFPPSKNTDRIINYIVGVIYDASHINADDKMILKIVDMMITSAVKLNDIKEEKQA